MNKAMETERMTAFKPTDEQMEDMLWPAICLIEGQLEMLLSNDIPASYLAGTLRDIALDLEHKSRGDVNE